MALTLGIVFIALALLWRARVLHHDYLVRKYSYAMSALRDKLHRKAAIEGRMCDSDWRFRYLDTTISRTITDLDSLNIFVCAIAYNRYKTPEALDSFHKFRDVTTLGLMSDIRFKDFYLGYRRLLTEYVKEEHFILSYIKDFSQLSWQYPLMFFEGLRFSFKIPPNINLQGREGYFYEDSYHHAWQPH